MSLLSMIDWSMTLDCDGDQTKRRAKQCLGLASRPMCLGRFRREPGNMSGCGHAVFGNGHPCLAGELVTLARWVSHSQPVWFGLRSVLLSAY